jgi:hypothetical protein
VRGEGDLNEPLIPESLDLCGLALRRDVCVLVRLLYGMSMRHEPAGGESIRHSGVLRACRKRGSGERRTESRSWREVEVEIL